MNKFAELVSKQLLKEADGSQVEFKDLVEPAFVDMQTMKADDTYMFRFDDMKSEDKYALLNVVAENEQVKTDEIDEDNAVIWKNELWNIVITDKKSNADITKTISPKYYNVIWGEVKTLYK